MDGSIKSHFSDNALAPRPSKKNYNLALSARSLFLRRPRNLGIILYKLSMLSVVNVSGIFETTVLLCPLNVLQTAASNFKNMKVYVHRHRVK